jgi:hypothetical protein
MLTAPCLAYLTHAGRAALERYTAALRQLLDQANP